MKDSDLDNEVKVISDNLEYEEYEKSGSEDDFQTWKLKRYIDSKVNSLYWLIIFISILFIILLKI